MKSWLVIVFAVVAALLDNTSATPRQAPIQIASGFEYMGVADGKVFLIPIKAEDGTDNLTYQEAIAKCASVGYKIATIETEAQNNVLKPYVRTDTADKCKGWRWSWIDGVDFQTVGNWFSISSGKNLEFFDWVQGWPVKQPGWNCIRISCNAMYGPKWWNVPCTDKLSVICETKI